jgi:hypothetical protein
VNVNPLESNFEALSITQLEELAQVSRAQFHTAAGNQGSISELLNGKQLWHYFLLLAIALLALEQIFVMILYRGHPAREYTGKMSLLRKVLKR